MAKQIGSTEILEELGKQTEKVKVEIEVPMGIVEFLDHLGEVPYTNVPTVKEFAEQAVLGDFEALLSQMPCSMFDYAGIHRWYGVRDYPNKDEVHLAAKWP
jgi:hypothetical protein